MNTVNIVVYSYYVTVNGRCLCGNDVAAVLSISRANAYNLLWREDFPTLHIGKRMVVPKDRFIQWIEKNTQ